MLVAYMGTVIILNSGFPICVQNLQVGTWRFQVACACHGNGEAASEKQTCRKEHLGRGAIKSIPEHWCMPCHGWIWIGCINIFEQDDVCRSLATRLAGTIWTQAGEPVGQVQ